MHPCPSQTAPGMVEANALAIPVDIGVELEDWIEVRSENFVGTQVVVRGNERIPPSLPVLLQAASCGKKTHHEAHRLFCNQSCQGYRGCTPHGSLRVVALLRMPMQLTPEVQTPTITIETRWPGPAPKRWSKRSLSNRKSNSKGVEELTKMSSECSDSIGRITLEFLVGTQMQQSVA